MVDNKMDAHLEGEKLKPIRESNIEILRIVAMSMILIHHFICHGTESSHLVLAVVDGFCLSGVDLFFMISGYFGIKYCSNNIIKFVLTIFAFGEINLLLIFLFGGCITPFQIIGIIIYSVSGSPYWFVKIYLLLMLSAPVINYGLSAMPYRTLKMTIVLLVAVVVYMHGTHASYNYLNGFIFYYIVFLSTKPICNR